MKLLLIFIVFILAFLIGQLIILRIYFFSFRRRLFDPVDNRKVHLGLIPRLGGMAFLPTQCGIFMLSLVIIRYFGIVEIEYAFLVRFLLLLCGLGLLFVVGIIDDLLGIDYRWKFLTQIVAISVFPISGLWIDNLGGLFGVYFLSPIAGIPLTIFLGVLIINAYNLIDGIDGLCSGLSILACVVFGTLFFIRNSWLYVLFCFITVGVLSPFFYYNVFGKSKRKRRIFMGDTGSLTLGLTITFLIVSYMVDNPNPSLFRGSNILVAFSVVIVPVFDVIRVILVRFLAHKPLFSPDRNHIHHYFLNLGFTKHVTLSYILLIALCFIVFNMSLTYRVNINVLLLLDIGLWVAGLGLIGKMKRLF
ncbi:undecaprenyl-phosphate alpha-N-acetylglucosaminyl 1-phosphate transferase [Bacteroidia bacterium]|nr:undecaprenyl-phosphate alpha-N-acetylglucosaminyl 1-phosphate transferase [Bacteroidia bacterium]